jgi:hypothetical protein
VIKWDVEIGSFSFELLMTRLNDDVKWSPSQCAVVWFFDKRLSKDVRLENQFKMDEMFDMYKDQMKCQIIVGVFDNTVSHVDEFDALEPLCVLSPDICTGSLQLSPLIPNRAVSNANQPISKPNNAAEVPLEAELEPDREPDREPDIFDNAEEYVGYDDETMYLAIPPTQPLGSRQPSSSAQASSSPPPSPVHVYENADDVPVEAEVTDADPEEIHVIHDPENPEIVKGELFPDIVAFRKAIRHHAVKKGFKFKDIKTDKTRFIAKCKAEGCPWRIHASRLYDGKTIQVITCDLVILSYTLLYPTCYLCADQSISRAA